MTKSTFKSKVYISNEILELVHTDLCGPIEIQRYRGDRYIMLFVDDYSNVHVFETKIRRISNVQMVLGSS